MSSKALDEEGHCDDKANAHEEDAIPVGLRRTNARGVSKPNPNNGCFQKIFLSSLVSP